MTKDQESIVKLFEELGFDRRHRKTDIEAGANTAIAMKDANGNRISIASSETVPQDLTGIILQAVVPCPVIDGILYESVVIACASRYGIVLRTLPVFQTPC